MVWLLGTTCCWPGCGHRLGVQVDHLDEYASDDGATDQDNADPLHGRHNRFKTSHGYRVTRDERGIIHVYRPDGTEIRPRCSSHARERHRRQLADMKQRTWISGPNALALRQKSVTARTSRSQVELGALVRSN